MKKTTIFILAAFLFLFAACDPLPDVTLDSTGSAVLAALSVPEKYDYEYQKVNGGIQITKYNGSELNVKVPDEIDGQTVVSIGDWAFAEQDITEVMLPDTVTSIGWGAFSESDSLKKVTLPKNLTEIKKFAFSNCTSLAEIEIPDGVTAIGYGAFSECSGLKAVKLPAALKKIEFCSFAGCKVLESINIPDGVTEIEYSAFYRCLTLPHITIPASVTKIGEGVFEECENLTAVCYGDYGAQYCRDNGIVCEKR
jgi:hypothetical protein